MFEGTEQEWLDRHEAVVSDAMRLQMYPFVAAAQDGVKMTNVDGEEAIDFFGAWAVGNTGYRHPDVLAAVADQMETLVTASGLTTPHPPMIRLAERLRRVAGLGAETKVWFGHSGSEAGDLIAKAVPTVGDGDVVVTFDGSYHGETMASAGISGHGAQAGVGEGVVSVEFPYVYRADVPPSVHRDELLEAVKTAFEEHDVAGLITEPIQSDGGIRVPPEGFLEGLADLCHDHGAYFVIDEVKAGLGRTGRLFAHHHADVTPDAIMVGKPLGSGFPISAVVGDADLVDYEPAGHMMTTAAAPVCAAAGIATLDVIEAEGLTDRAARMGERLAGELERATADIEAVGDIRGRGLIRGVELVDPGDGRPAPELTAGAVLQARRRGVLVAYVGTASNVIELTPPLTIDEDTIGTGVRRLAEAIREAAAGDVDTAALDRFRGW